MYEAYETIRRTLIDSDTLTASHNGRTVKVTANGEDGPTVYLDGLVVDHGANLHDAINRAAGALSEA